MTSVYKSSKFGHLSATCNLSPIAINTEEVYWGNFIVSAYLLRKADSFHT